MAQESGAPLLLLRLWPPGKSAVRARVDGHGQSATSEARPGNPLARVGAAGPGADAATRQTNKADAPELPKNATNG